MRSTVRAARVDDLDALPADAGDVALLEDDERTRHGQERRDVGRDEVLLLAEADQERAAGAREHDAVRVLAPHHRERIGAAQFGDGLLHGLEQVAAPGQVIMNAVRDDLGIGVRGELVAGALELGPELLVVLDDAVVDDRDAVARDVRMGVLLVRHAVRRPARVGDAEVTGSRVRRQGVRELRYLADGAQARDLGAAVQDGDAGRVIPAVFEAPQALDQDRDDVPVSDRSDDAAHVAAILTRRLARGPEPTESRSSGPGRIPCARPGSRPPFERTRFARRGHNPGRRRPPTARAGAASRGPRCRRTPSGVRRRVTLSPSASARRRPRSRQASQIAIQTPAVLSGVISKPGARCTYR